MLKSCLKGVFIVCVIIGGLIPFLIGFGIMLILEEIKVNLFPSSSKPTDFAATIAIALSIGILLTFPVSIPFLVISFFLGEYFNKSKKLNK